ncbi:MAG: pathogenicity locus [Candidatus Liptonbacteria bacterium]|nr:pathogenicity locus [Candidatus Liptonbacteria bacterium]
MENKKESLRALRTIPGVGKEIAEDFWNIGIRAERDLKGRDPEKLYQKLCACEGRHIDRCMLYVMRCAVYYASHARHNPELLKWWNWKS